MGMWGARWGPGWGVGHVQKAAFSSLPRSSGRRSFTLGLAQKPREAHLPGGERVLLPASVISGSPGQFLVSLEHFHRRAWCQAARREGCL